MGNQIRTTILLAVMTALILWIGQLFGGRQGMIIALLLAAGMNFFSYWYSDKIVLKMYRAQEVSPQETPELYEMVQALSRKAGLPMPKLFVIPKEAPNAFATGRNPEHAVVAVTHPPLEERIARLRGYPAGSSPDSKSGEGRRQVQAKAFWDRLSGE